MSSSARQTTVDFRLHSAFVGIGCCSKEKRNQICKTGAKIRAVAMNNPDFMVFRASELVGERTVDKLEAITRESLECGNKT